MPFLIAGVAALAVAFIAIGIAASTRDDPLRARLTQLGTMSRSASRRDLPTRTSARARRNSSTRGPFIFSVTLPSAASNARPARTEIVRRSRASGRARRIAFWRARTRPPSQNSGTM